MEGLYPQSGYAIPNYDVRRDGKSMLLLKNIRPENLEIRVVLVRRIEEANGGELRKMYCVLN